MVCVPCASAQLDQSSLCTQWIAKDPRFLHVDSEDWSDRADVQADLSLRLAHRSLNCWFCHLTTPIYAIFSSVSFYMYFISLIVVCFN